MQARVGMKIKTYICLMISTKRKRSWAAEVQAAIGAGIQNQRQKASIVLIFAGSKNAVASTPALAALFNGLGVESKQAP